MINSIYKITYILISHRGLKSNWLSVVAKINENLDHV